MGWDDVSELQPPTGILFIPQVIYEHGEPWWWYVHQGSLANLPAESSGSKQEEWAKGMSIWPCKVFLFILQVIFLHTVKSYNMGPPALLLLRSKVCCGLFITRKSTSPRPGLKPQNLGPKASTLTLTPQRHVLLGQSCRKPHGAVIDGFGATVERSLIDD
jgi:hypothetical protein